MLTKRIRTLLDQTFLVGRDKIKVKRIILSYLLGLSGYPETYRRLRKFKVCYGSRRQPVGLHRFFVKMLKHMTDHEVHHILNNVRMYAFLSQIDPKAGDDFKQHLSKEDVHMLDAVRHRLNFEEVVIPESYPQIEEILDDMKVRIQTISSECANRYSSQSEFDASFDRKDFISELSMRIVHAYRVYIYGYGRREKRNEFNKKVLYKCLWNTVKTGKIDIIRGLSSKGSVVNKHLPLDEHFHPLIKDTHGEALLGFDYMDVEPGIITRQNMEMITDVVINLINDARAS